MANDNISDAGGVELRLTAPRKVIDLVDAISLARRVNRSQMVIAILHEWAEVKHREITIANRISGRNPRDAGADGSESDFGALSSE